MKISLDDLELYSLSDTQKKVIKDSVNSDAFEDDAKRRLAWVLQHKYEQCFKRLKTEWEPKLAKAGVESIPTNKDAFAELVFTQTEYKDRKARDDEVEEI